jgi:8-oxo-dGTP diphosphatase
MIRVAAAIIEKDGRLLICQRRAQGVFALKWEFPGGKLRTGETPWEGLARELREELGIEARIGAELYEISYRYAEEKLDVKVAFYSASFAGWPLNRTFERIEWVPRSELPRYDFLAADRVLVTRLVQDEWAKARITRQSTSRRRRPAPAR